MKPTRSIGRTSMGFAGCGPSSPDDRPSRKESFVSQTATIYRVDKFVVPASAREEFLRRVIETHQVLRRQPGFVRDSILEQISGPGRFNIVTVAEWQSQAAIDAARAAVSKAQAESGFDPRETIARLGIEADIANYASVGA